MQEPLPPDYGPGKLQGQELKSRLSCPNPPFSPPCHPSSSSSPPSSPSSSASTSHGAPNGLLYIHDMLSRRAAGGQPIASWGKCTIPLSFSSTSSRTHRFDWNFMLAAVNCLILSADFLRQHQFDMSIAQHQLDSVDGEVQLPLLPSSTCC